MKHPILILAAIAAVPVVAGAQEAFKSPCFAESTADGLSFFYSAPDSALQLMRLDCGAIEQLGEPTYGSTEYTMVTGKKRLCSNQYEQQLYRLSDGDTLAVRFYTDGLAWHKKGASTIEFVAPEHTWLQEWSDCYENFFPRDLALSEGKHIGYPALVEYPGGVFGLLTESAITPDGAGTSMFSRGGYAFDLRPDGPEDGGWQTFIVGTLPQVVESTFVTDIAAPSTMADTSWIEPGLASWVYWAYNHGSSDYDIICKYVDLAAELKLPYVLIDAEWDEMADGHTVEDAVAYAVERGVKPLIWYSSSIGWVDGAPGPKFRLNTAEDLEKEFAWCERLGIKGVKIDFFSGDTNINWRFMDELLQAAERHHLLVNFHGSPLPRGWQRTYPHFVSTESVYGEEWYNNKPTLTNKAACHNATLPFTRNVIGSMDYTPCAFTDSQYPHITTHAHELALTALYESGIQHLADRPESFLAQPQQVKDYLSELPAAWDETVLLGGYPGKYAVIARKKDGAWWIAAINGTDEPFTVPALDYSRLSLDSSNLAVQIIEDAPVGSESPWCFTDTTALPSTLTLLPRGGAVMVVR